MLTQLKTYPKLLKHYEEIKEVHMRDWFSKDKERASRYFVQLESLSLDYSKNRLNDTTLKLLFELAKDCSLKEKIEAMFKGEKINTTEKRAVLHTALRSLNDAEILLDNMEVLKSVRSVLKRMRAFSDSVRSGKRLGYTNQVITDIVNIGIGGSDLGALMVCTALKRYGHPRLKMHFVSNVDGTQILDVLEKINPASTLFIVASKTFSTQETLTNALTARKWFVERSGDEKHIAKHFVAVSTNKEAVQQFGIDEHNMFEFWDFVGGRYSLWSAIGLSIMIYLGKKNFNALLKGAYLMDEHFRNAPFESNLPVLMGLIGVWYINFFQSKSHLIAPYDQYLRHFPKFIQQLDMESNGKRISKKGEIIPYDTCPVVWGDMGINAQHAFFQLLHQGTHLIPIDFIASLDKKPNAKGHHEILFSNVLAQAQAFMKGKSYEEALGELLSKGLDKDEAKDLAHHRVFFGNRPSNILLLEKISPSNIGALVALYEHKVFVQGVIWDINSFDQWGVELGKELAVPILQELEGHKSNAYFDSSTRHLIELYKNYNQ
ncbi:glucose-6-phosphate isomerase [Helicobacter pylori]|uniref:Glucose-6-phosphate isomerase n=1 Tax=Helicobacter pylori (strain J99 / ATCC 700824) TaxID=85963 RepID=G6PI_HELPJ|nr:glucose-6-phosphate isomerase [Helicobacter pylori]Q9ZK49.1 RecName: Full=Glucose-6-phosphate isomerase; Short=GPI; AltName: Full=Phosphoglucose isomerase; Short=PGI; AltName: Full=Phosphohexose isomerase; Short=PHI [Helicobacter pylori J99]AAD06664.1 glucose-6-phosphate isomerase [Helicobacter pylori J99]AKE82360.1 glucose-6-phosphate isomerase [Helicobacter pylori J99]AVL48252.1 glucose-6-phosphate isomerase [Helicobacter pylori]MWR19925.1 glucose-6-phosphate isomerase [Helicobacter pylor